MDTYDNQIPMATVVLEVYQNQQLQTSLKIQYVTRILLIIVILSGYVQFAIYGLDGTPIQLIERVIKLITISVLAGISSYSYSMYKKLKDATQEDDLDRFAMSVQALRAWYQKGVQFFWVMIPIGLFYLFSIYSNSSLSERVILAGLFGACTYFIYAYSVAQLQYLRGLYKCATSDVDADYRPVTSRVHNYTIALIGTTFLLSLLLMTLTYVLLFSWVIVVAVIYFIMQVIAIAKLIGFYSTAQRTFSEFQRKRYREQRKER